MELSDRIYLVISEPQNGPPIIWEIELHRMGRASVRLDIAEGQYGHVLKVIEIDLAAGSSRDVTKEFVIGS